MKPHLQLAETRTPEGGRLTLHTHDGTYSIRLNGRELMHSAMHASECALGELAAAHLPRQGRSRVLIGGLGLGFTLRRVLELAGRDTAVDVAELLPEIADWNREFLAPLNGKLLGDPRVKVIVGDVFALLAKAKPESFNSIALDIDNGPVAMVQSANRRLYDLRGLDLIRETLKPGGRLIVWSAGPDRAFARRLTRVGFNVDLVPAKLHHGARQAACTLFVADRPMPRAR